MSETNIWVGRDAEGADVVAVTVAVEGETRRFEGAAVDSRLTSAQLQTLAEIRDVFELDAVDAELAATDAKRTRVVAKKAELEALQGRGRS